MDTPLDSLCQNDTPPADAPLVLAESRYNAVYGEEHKLAALAAFKAVGTVQAACDAVKISRSTWQRWYRDDPGFRTAVQAADESITDKLEAEAIRRAVLEKNDTLLWQLLRARRRRYHDKTVEVVPIAEDERWVKLGGIIRDVLHSRLSADVADAILAEISAAAETDG